MQNINKLIYNGDYVSLRSGDDFIKQRISISSPPSSKISRTAPVMLDWDDLSIVPSEISYVNSRSQVNPFTADGTLPIFTAPMDTVIGESNSEDFIENKINICYPRNVKWSKHKNNRSFYSYGIDEVESVYLSEDVTVGVDVPNRLLIDLAQGHLNKLYEISKRIKDKYGDTIELMIGNIANPAAYKYCCEAGVDYVRVGIGAGSACTTSANASVHYPMASLIDDIYTYKNVIGENYENPTKIVADGGFRKFSDIIKALGMGADYVMIGGIFNKCLESISSDFILDSEGNYKGIFREEAEHILSQGGQVYKYFRGMSTKEVQKEWNKEVLKTSEGITKFNLVEFSLYKWSENLTDYIKSAMSYSNSTNLEEFKDRCEFVRISEKSFKRFNK